MRIQIGIGWFYIAIVLTVVFVTKSLCTEDAEANPRPSSRRYSNVAAVRSSSGLPLVVNTTSMHFQLSTSGNEYATVATADANECNGAAATWAFWVKRETRTVAAAPGYALISQYGGASNGAWRIMMPVGNTPASQLNWGGVSSCGGALQEWTSNSVTDVFPLDTWVHIVIIYDGSQAAASRIRAFRNGVELTGTLSGTIPATLPNCGSATWLGFDNGATNTVPFNGNLDEVMMECSVPTSVADAVSLLYGGGIPRDLSAYTSGTVPVFLYRGDGSTHPTLTNSGSGGNMTMTNTEAIDFESEVPNGSSLFANTFSSRMTAAAGTYYNGATTGGQDVDHDCDDEDKFTACWWIKPDTAATTILGGKWGYAWGADTIYTSGTKSAVRVTMDSGGGALTNHMCTTGDVLVQDTWNHFCIVYDGSLASATDSRVKTYLNGAATTCPMTGTIPATLADSVAPLRIGNRLNGGGTQFTGNVDEFFYACDAATAGNILTYYNSGAAYDYNNSTLSQKRVWLDFNNRSMNRPGFGLYATSDFVETNNAVYETSPLPGDTVNFSNTQSLSLNGTAYLDTADGEPQECDTENQMTICAWIRPTAVASNQAILDKWNHGTANTYIWRLSNTEMTMFVASTNTDAGANNCASTNASITAGAWQHVCVVYDGAGAGNTDKVKFYKNGTLLTASCSGTIPATLRNNNGGVRIGSIQNLAANLYTGLIDELGMWCDAMNQSEVTAAYNGGATRNLSTLANTEQRIWFRAETSRGVGSSNNYPGLSANNFTENSSPTYSTTVP
jgi:hypothetical protein